MVLATVQQRDEEPRQIRDGRKQATARIGGVTVMWDGDGKAILRDVQRRKACWVDFGQEPPASRHHKWLEDVGAGVDIQWFAKGAFDDEPCEAGSDVGVVATRTRLCVEEVVRE